MKCYAIITFALIAVLAACDSAPLPTLAPMTDSSSSSEPTTDPNLGAGFDPELGNVEDEPTAEPTPTRESDTDVGSSSDAESGGGNIGFVATLTGAVEAAVATGGSMQCDSSRNQIALGTGQSDNNTMTFIFPADSGAGTLNINDDVTVTFQPNASEVYDQNASGTLTLATLPSSVGEAIKGSFEITVGNGTDSISATGEFDFIVPNAGLCR